MTDINTVDRRTFMRRGAMGAGAFWALSLNELAARGAYGRAAGPSPYGAISPKLDENTGLPLLQLPDGFRYRSYGWRGDSLGDGTPTPGAHDGMAVIGNFFGHPDLVVLIRNHEVDVSAQPFLPNRPDITYRSDGGGGNSALIFDLRQERFVKAWPVLAGTVRNCAGGVTPWNSWVTCEETGANGHGWCFDVGIFRGDPTPLTDMGRFSHEALMVDPASGYVYETEDSGSNSGFYRFVPNVHSQLKQGGELFMLKVKNVNQLNLGLGYPIGTTWDVEWVRIDDPRATTQSVFAQGFAKSAARFRRLEGAWWGNNTGYFLATEGGGITQGQVFEYNPLAETLRLIYESQSADDCDNPDNMTVTPRGGLLLCEDEATAPQFTAGERLLGLSLDGQIFTFCQNNVVLAASPNGVVGPGDYRGQEFAGATYSPDGKWLFVNIQTPGITFAITGPWGTGPL